MNHPNPVGFSIITPVYNRANCIHRCIESVACQHYDNIEHWIIDDGSTDDTATIIEQQAQQYSFIRYHRFNKNKGVNAARNYGIRHISKEFIIFLDSDDYLVEDALATVSRNILSHAGYFHYLFAQDDRLAYYNQHPVLQAPVAVLTFADFLTGKVTGDFAHVVAGELIKQFPFNEDLRIYEGLTFLQIFKAGGKQFFVKEVIVNRERGRTDSVTREYRLHNRDALNRQYISLKETLSLFHEDYIRWQADNALSHLIKRIFLLGLMLEKYGDNNRLKETARAEHIHLPFIIRLLNKLHLGFGFRNATFVYSYLKNKLVVTR
jgi:glycosyltransferase involved in cell wall biosynthesis